MIKKEKRHYIKSFANLSELTDYIKSIPSHRWTTGTWERSQAGMDTEHCFLGHFGLHPHTSYPKYNKNTVLIDELFQMLRDEKAGLKRLFPSGNGVDIAMYINDNGQGVGYIQSNAKDRMLAALEDIKKICQLKHKIK